MEQDIGGEGDLVPLLFPCGTKIHGVEQKTLGLSPSFPLPFPVSPSQDAGMPLGTLTVVGIE